MYENVSVEGTRSWVADVRSREGALFWTRTASGFLAAVGATLVVLGLDPVVVGGLVAAWSTFLELLGRQIRGDVYAEQTVDRIAADAYLRGQRLDIPAPGDRPDGYGITGGC